MKKRKYDDEATFRQARNQAADALSNFLANRGSNPFDRDKALALITQCQMVDYRILKSPWRDLVNEND